MDDRPTKPATTYTEALFFRAKQVAVFGLGEVLGM
jgi:hypothetical protein